MDKDLEFRYAKAMAQDVLKKLLANPFEIVTFSCRTREEIAEIYKPAFEHVIGEDLLERVIFTYVDKEA